MKRSKKKKKKQPLHPKRICPNCGEIGSHFVPPSFGDKGFFICEPKSKTNKPLKLDGLSCALFEDCKYYNKWGKCYPDCLDYQPATEL